VEHVGYKKNVYMVLVAKYESKKPLGRPRRKREDNIKTDLYGTGWEAEGAAQDRDSCRAGSCEHDNKYLVPRNSETF
jgi:hypothetical protein